MGKPTHMCKRTYFTIKPCHPLYMCTYTQKTCLENDYRQRGISLVQAVKIKHVALIIASFKIKGRYYLIRTN